MLRPVSAFAIMTALLLQPACGIIPPGANDGGGGGGTDPSVCEGNGCNDCTQCATAGACRAQLANCQDDSFCIGLDQCISLCNGMVQCEDDCFAMNSPGVAAYRALRECVHCDSCPGDCAGQTICE